MSTENGQNQNIERSATIRGAHRAVLTRLIKEAEPILMEESHTEHVLERLQILSGSIQSEGKLLDSLDEDVLSKTEIDDIANEVDQSSLISEKIIEVGCKINILLEKKKLSDKPMEVQSNTSESNIQADAIVDMNRQVDTNTSIHTNTSTQVDTNMQENTNLGEVSNDHSSQITTEINQAHQVTTVKLAKPKLPKLSLPKFTGDVKKWHAFWDLFESLIHKNEEMSPIDKFNYLNTLLEDEAAELFRAYH